MSGSEWAAWIGAITGVVALSWEVVRWLRSGPRLRVRASPDMKLAPGLDERDRPFLAVYVTNVGTVRTTLTSFAVIEFKSALDRWRMKPGRNWVVIENSLGANLPHELQPGQQWTAGLSQTEKIAEMIAQGNLWVAIYHAYAPKRPALAHVRPSAVANG